MEAAATFDFSKKADLLKWLKYSLSFFGTSATLGDMHFNRSPSLVNKLNSEVTSKGLTFFEVYKA